MKRIPRPLKGHPYHGKSDAELGYIVYDARLAANAMRDFDAKAESKYLDQINDARTIMNYRVAMRGDRRPA